MTTAIVPVEQITNFDILVDLTLKTVAKCSARQYAHACNKYATWCEDNGYPVELSVDFIYDFLTQQPVTRATRQVYLSALRKVAQIQMISGDPRHRALYEFLKEMRVPTEGEGGKERNKVALTPAQVEKILAYWRNIPEDPKARAIHIRNKAMVYLGLAIGQRRSEIAPLEWRDVNLDEGVVHIRHGKGDQSGDVAIIGDFGIQALLDWLKIQKGEYLYVFTPVLKGGHMGEDRPISDDTYYNAVKDTATAIGIGIDFATHDFRRTLITELGRTGANIRDIQAQARHKKESTTAGYMQAAAATERRRTMRVRWDGESGE